MRLVFCIGMILAIASPALAADYDLPILRGSQTPLPVAPVTTVGPATFTRWSGLYFGGVVSYSSASTDFSSATPPLVDSSLRGLTVDSALSLDEKTVLGRGSDVAFGGGGFLGYNTQWQDLILGVEATYTHTNLNTTASSAPIGRVFPGINSAVALNAAGRLDLTDYGEARFRAGYVVGNLLPYGFIGMAVGRASYSVSTIAVVAQATTGTDPCLTAPNFAGGTCQTFLNTAAAGQDNALLWGYSVGAGLDWALTRNFFLRGEFEFVQFAPISSLSLALVSGRVGAGCKF
jgi:outer membrane immunogenic protein